MKDLVEVIAKSLVENPDEVVVTETEKEIPFLLHAKLGAYIAREKYDIKFNHFVHVSCAREIR